MTTIYKKQGRRYVPVGEYDAEAMYYPPGATLVWCRPGDCGTLYRYRIEPAYAALEAALEHLRSAMLDAMHDAQQMRPQDPQPGGRRLTAKQRKGWEAYRAIAGDDEIWLGGKSLHDIADAAIAVLRAEMIGQRRMEDELQ